MAVRSFLPAAALLAASCAPQPPVLEVPFGEVRTAHDLVCAPAATWTAAADGDAPGGWSLRGVADVGCWVERAPEGGLTFWAEAADDGFRFTWDDEPLAPPRPAAGGWEVDVPAERLTPGAHAFAVLRRPAPGRDMSARLAAFGRLVGGERVPFDVSRAADHAYLAQFLLQGSAGRGDDKMGGVLALGPASLELPVTPRRAGSRLAVDVENAGQAPARVSWSGLTAAEEGTGETLTVAPGERRRLELVVGRGGADAAPPRLEVDGDADGAVLLGVPRLLGAAPAGRPPLVLLVTLDTTRKDALGVYGGAAGATPRIDDFAAGATVYENALSTAPWTLPAHVSMFTGLWAGRHGVGVDDERFYPHLDTLAGLFADQGYVSAGFAGGGLMSQRFGGARGFGRYRDPARGERPGDELTDLALAFAEEHRDSPLFLFVNYFDPHWPYRPRAEHAERFGVAEKKAELSHPAWHATAEGRVGPWRRITHGEVPATLDDMLWLRAVYHAEVAFMDAEVGRLFDGLRRLGLWDEAVVAVVADHGEQLGEGGYYGHAYRLDPELVEVPLVVKWPGQRVGRRDGRLASVVDLFPTLLAAAGVEPPASDGLPLAGGAAAGHGRVYYEEHSNRFHALQRARYRVAWHLWGLESASRRRVVWRDGESCAERAAVGWRAVDCGGDRERVLAALRRLLGAPLADEAVGGEIAEEDRAMLKALGYL